MDPSQPGCSAAESATHGARRGASEAQPSAGPPAGQPLRSCSDEFPTNSSCSALRTAQTGTGTGRSHGRSRRSNSLGTSRLRAALRTHAAGRLAAGDADIAGRLKAAVPCPYPQDRPRKLILREQARTGQKAPAGLIVGSIAISVEYSNCQRLMNGTPQISPKSISCSPAPRVRIVVASFGKPLSGARGRGRGSIRAGIQEQSGCAVAAAGECRREGRGRRGGRIGGHA